MPNTDINTAQLTAADLTDIKTSLSAVDAKMPFYQTLTMAQRKKLRKVGPERLSFVENALAAAQNHPDIFPATFDTAGFAVNVGTFQNMTEVNSLTAALHSKTDDTRIELGVISMDKASDVYNYVKAAAKKTPGLKPLADQLGVLYAKAAATRRANAKAKAATTTPPAK